MYTKQVKYTNFDGVEVQETLYFNLTKTELINMEASTAGSYSKKLEAIFKKKDIPQIMKYMEEIILAAYGIKSDDGNKFLKNDKIREEFKCSLAYDALYWEMWNDADKAADFMAKIMPVEISQEDIEKAKKELES